jgi:hypothetical protein
MMSGWADKGVGGRLAALAAELARHRGAMVKWQAGRLLGKFPNYQPKALLARR